ncbi:MAG: DUF2341 domain-containing protein [Melioribacteraceae bacterium]
MNLTNKKLFSFLFLLFYGSVCYGQEIDLSDWEYNKSILIDNKSNPDEFINHPFLIILDSTYLDFYLAKPNGEDLLFIDNDDESVLSLWIESWSPPKAKVWVNIPHVYSNSEKTLRMYYGNPNANSSSDGKSTFSLFDSFETFNVTSKNAVDPQITPTYDGSGQVVHPDIVHISDGWNGYKYWMVLNPYPGADDSFENPCIIVSDDGASWIEPPGISNPLAPTPDGWNNDPDMLLVNNEMIIYYNESNYDGNTYVKRMTSTDGISWSSPQTVVTEPWHLMSPTVLYEDGTYYMWYARSPGGCGGKEQFVTMRISDDGITWGSEIPVDVPIDGRVLWHLDIVKYQSEYRMLLASYSKNSRCGWTSLFYAESTDKINWSVNPTPIIIPTNSSSAWDNRSIYRSTFLMEDNFLRIWYTAVDVSEVWHLGYSEGDLSEYVDNRFWNKRQGDLIPSEDFSHSGSVAIHESQNASGEVPKVYKSIAKKGSYNVWYYDELNSESNYKAFFRITDIDDLSIGIGVNVNEFSDNYVYFSNSNFLDSFVPRSEGWHKLTIFVGDGYADLFIDDNYIDTRDDLDESNLTRLTLEGGSSGYAWFDDFYWTKKMDANPKIYPLSYPTIISSISDLSIKEDNSSLIIATLDTVFSQADTNITLTYKVVESDSSVIVWISDDKLWVEPKKDYFGLDSLFVSATNQFGFTSIDTVLLITQPVNDPPYFINLPDFFLNEDDTIIVNLNTFILDVDTDTSDIGFTANVIDSNNQNSVSSYIKNQKTTQIILGNDDLFIEINNSSNRARIYAKPNFNGEFQVLFIAIDDSLAIGIDTSKIVVSSINDTPVLSGLIDTIFTTNDSISSFNLWDLVEDEETEDSLLIFNLTSEHSEIEVKLNNQNGNLTVETIEYFIGSSNIYIEIKDENEAVVKDTFLVVVQDPTDIESLFSENLPQEFNLFQNYPNPFNPTTIIKFSLPSKSNVILDVYDLLGQKVLGLVDEQLNGGEYSVNLDASKLTSGVYVYLISVISSDNNIFRDSKKMVLLK